MPKEVISNTTLAWIEYDPRANTLAGRKALNRETQQRRIVRSHVAQTSSGVRKATIAKKEALRKAQELRDALLLSEQDGVQVQDDDIFRLLVRVGYRDATANATMASKTVRTLLWKAFVGNHTCFQAALFVSGTHANTCGIPSSAFHSTGFGSGLLFLRGASLEGIQATVIETPKDSLNSVSIALLAGWERRFGDQESYKVHMQAWKALPLATGSLDSNSIATLADVALESFREVSQERVLTHAARLPVNKTNLPPGLPPGLEVISTSRPEAASLLGLVAKIATFDPTSPNAISVFRAYCLENMSWTASHSISVEPVEAYEEAWEQNYLNALYHVRSALVSINGVILNKTLDIHKVPWDFDLQTGYNIHAEACQHLRSKALMGTRYQDLAIWAKVSMGAIASESESINENLRPLIKHARIETWEQLESLLKKFVYPEQWLAGKYRRLFEALSD